MSFKNEFQHLKIQLQDIKLATENFSEKSCIGGGGFGKVYKGEVSHSKGRSMAAFKRLDRKSDQGDAEFWKEIGILTRYSHENLISLLGFCDEDRELILVYEYASHGSLDAHLKDANLTWRKRLKICLEAAKALEFLHDPRGTHQRVLHCDIKSGNILLDENWVAKLSDLGLSKMGPANQQYSFLISSAVGTLGYCDPLYLETGFLTKESDVYSFGVLLFEVLFGRFCYEKREGRVHILVPTWKQNYKQKKIEEILILQDIDPSSLELFSDIAYRCLERFREDRPKMSEVVTELEIALESQEISEGKAQLFDYEEMIKTTVPPLNYRSKAELMILLSKGVLLNGGKTFFSFNTKGQHCELISMAECLNIVPKSDSYSWSTEYSSRFVVGSYDSGDGKFSTRVRTQFLTPLVTYTVNLVFKFENPTDTNFYKVIPLKYKLEEETETSVSYLVGVREDGWLMLELYQLTSDRRIVDLKILFKGWDLYHHPLQIEGIEFRPLQEVKYRLLEDEKVEMQPISDSDAYWEQRLPINYEDIIKCSKDTVQWTTKKELYSVLCKGFLINNGQEWFFLDKNGKKCHMLSARAACVMDKRDLRQKSLPDTRFGEAIILNCTGLKLVCEIKSKVLSSQTTYAGYLVYKLPKDMSALEAPVEVSYKDMVTDDWKEDECWYIYLVSPPQTPVIRPKDDENTHNLLNWPKIKGIPQQRSDGWMEVQVWEFHTSTTTEMTRLSLKLRCPYGHLYKLKLQGIEFRPI